VSVPSEHLTTVLRKDYQEAFERIVAYVSPHQCEGWIENWFWDVVHGRRPWPFWLEPDEQILGDMHVLLDQARVWFAWSFTRQVWGVVRVAIWAEHAKRNGVAEAQNMCADFQRRIGRAREKKEKEAQPSGVVVEEEVEKKRVL